MKIMHVIPGSGGSFYCGNCLRDSKYVVAMRDSDHQVVKLPMYLPLFADEHDITREIPVFYGAVSIYLKQQYPLFRKAPRWFDRLLNSKPMLRLASRFAGSTRAKGLEEMTVSMLLGEEGQQREELERMVDWIAEHCSPDIIHLSNALLLGLAHRLRDRMKVPVICSLQDEDVWVDVMKPGARDTVWRLMSDKSNYVCRFISVSNYYAKVMQSKINIPDQKLSTIHIGVDPGDYEFIEPSKKPRNIGFVSRLCHENGLDILVDAFIDLKQKQAYTDVGLVLTGGYTGDDKDYLSDIRRKLKEKGLADQVDWHADFEEQGLRDFFRKVKLISVPVRNGEAFGIYLLESMASGIPVVQPALGAFPEIVNTAGGGLIFEPDTPGALSEALQRLLDNAAAMDELAYKGRDGVKKHFDIRKQADDMIRLYQMCLEEKPQFA